MDEIILQENNKLSAEDDAHNIIDSEIDENDIYGIYNVSLDKNKENNEWYKRAFENEIKYIERDIEIQNGMTCMHVNQVNKIVDEIYPMIY